MRPIDRITVTGGALALTLGLWAAPASAHVEPSVGSAPAGSSQTISFTIPHGCDGSPTTKIAMKMPAGSSAVTPVEVAGWTSETSPDDSEVTWIGGPLPDDQKQAFGVKLTLPGQGESAAFPAIQTCERGEMAWIQATPAGGEEPEFPAPIVKLTAAGTTPVDSPEHDQGSSAADHGAEHSADVQTSDVQTSDVQTSDVQTVEATSSETSSGSQSIAELTRRLASAEDEASSARTIGVIALAVGALALVAGIAGLARSRRSAPTTET